MSERFAAPVVSLIVESLDGDRKILLQRRSKIEVPGLEHLFELPQGRMREGELIIDCAIRELHEETGLVNFQSQSRTTTTNVLGEDLQIVTALMVSERGQHSYLAVCLVGTAEGVPRSSSESSDPRWYSREDTLRLIQEGRVFPLNVPMILNYYRTPSE